MPKIIRLTPIQAKILTHIELQPELTLAQIGKRIRARPSTIAYNITRLKQNGIIRRTLVINPFVLGLSYVALFFSARFKNSDRRKDLIRKLRSNEKVIWLGSLAGEFHFGLTVLIRELHELQSLLEPIFDSSGAELTDKLVAPRQSFTFFGRSWDGSLLKSRQRINVSPSVGGKYVEIDPVDRKILFALSLDSEKSGREIASALGLPVSTVERRIHSMKERGVIAGLRYSVNGDKLGLNTYRILLTLPGMSAASRNSLSEFALRTPAVQAFIESFGSWDAELLVETKSSEELRTLLEELMDSSGVIFQRVTVLSELDDLKFAPWPTAF